MYIIKKQIRRVSSFWVFVLYLLFLLCMTTRAQPEQKRFTFYFEDVPLRTIISAIEERTGRIFVYNSLQFNLDAVASLNIRDATLTDVLISLLKPFDIFFRIYGEQIVVAEFSSPREPLKLPEFRVGSGVLKSDEYNLTGRVVSLSGAPLPGASVVAGNSNYGTITDKEGRFVFKVRAGTLLTFSHLGFEPVVKQVGSRTDMRIVLREKILPVSEVVVTALGMKRRRKALGYAQTNLQGSVLAGAHTSNPVNAFMGRVSGLEVQPTDGGVFGSSRITIRGISTLRENNQPVFVIDGIVMDNSIGGGTEWGGLDWGNNLKSLNPDDFESVTVLKGAAASALYGSKAMNGVVLINSKEGVLQQRIRVDFSQTFSISDVYDGPDFQNKYGAGTVAGYATRLDDRFAPASGFFTNSADDPVVNSTLLSYGPPFNSHTRVRYRNGAWIYNKAQPDNYLQAFKNGQYLNSHLAVSGGKEEVRYRFSYSHTRDKGIYYRNIFNRNALSGSLFYSPLPQVNTEFNISYSGSDLFNPPAPFLQQAFLTTEFGRDYDTRQWMDTYKAQHGGIPSSDNNDPYHQVPGHEVWFRYFEDVHHRFEEGIRLVGRLKGTLFPWLGYNFTGAMNHYNIQSTDKEPGRGVNRQGGYYGVGDLKKKQQTYRLILQGERVTGAGLRANLTVGAELFKTRTEESYSNTAGGFIVPGKFSLENSIGNPVTRNDVLERIETQSLFFLNEWSWNDQLFLTFTGRNDWSSTLAYGNYSGNTGFFYPSLSGSWVFSDSFNFPRWLLFGKLRASYARVGSGFSAFALNPSFVRVGILEQGETTVPLITYEDNFSRDSDIQPERKHATEAGIEMNLFDNRLQFDFSVYRENTYNQIVTVAVPPESGVDFRVTNAGNIQNRGIELSLEGVPFKTDDFQVFGGVLFTRNRNRVIELTPGVDELVLENSPTYGNARTGSVAMVGKPLGLLVTDAAPLVYQNAQNESDPLNGLPVLTWNEYARGAYPLRSNKQRVVGDINPDFFGSLQLGMKFKKFTLSTLIDYKIGGDIVSFSNRYGTAYGLLESSLMYRDAENGGISWTSANGNTYHDGMIPLGVFEPGTIIEGYQVGGMSYRQAYESGYVEPVHASFWHYFSGNWSTGTVGDNMILENSYVGLREARLSYTFSGHLFGNVLVKDGTISVFGRNVGFLWKTLPNNLHPFGIRSNRAAAAHEWGLSPYVRNIGVELKLRF